MEQSIALIAALDTKGEDCTFVRSLLEGRGQSVIVIDTGVRGVPGGESDISREQVASAGGAVLREIAEEGDRGRAVDIMAEGAANLVGDLFEDGRIAGVIGMGGSAGTTIGTLAMRRLPMGFPKVMISTIASGNTRPYVGQSDVLMVPAIVDVAGINRISRLIYSRAVDVMMGMLRGNEERLGAASHESDGLVVSATMFGVTTACVSRARTRLEASGYEVVTFHATGTGGGSMERLILEGLIDASLDLTTTEWADELVGGDLSAGPHRLEAAGKKGIPQVVSVGALDMVNLGPLDQVPNQFRHRKLHRHNAHNTLMRTTSEECGELGRILASKLNVSTGPTALVLPLRGLSALDSPGEPFHDPHARTELFASLRANLDTSKVSLTELELHINDPDFADACVNLITEMLSHDQREKKPESVPYSA